MAAIVADRNEILVARRGAPLIIGRGHNKICVSSDVQPFYGVCSEVAFLNDGDILSISESGIQVSYKPEKSPIRNIRRNMGSGG